MMGQAGFMIAYAVGISYCFNCFVERWSFLSCFVSFGYTFLLSMALIDICMWTSGNCIQEWYECTYVVTSKGDNRSCCGPFSPCQVLVFAVNVRKGRLSPVSWFTFVKEYSLSSGEFSRDSQKSSNKLYEFLDLQRSKRFRTVRALGRSKMP